MSEALMYATVAIGVANASLAAGLLAVYARSYAKVRAPFTLGLMLFALFFVLHNALAVYAYSTMMGIVAEGLQPYLAAIMALEAAALGLMLYSSNR